MPTDNNSMIGGASRRSVVTAIGGLGALAAGGEIDFAEAADRPGAGKVYGVFAGMDKKSYMCVLTGGGSVPVYRMSLTGLLPPPSFEELHVSPFWGSVTMILQGQLEIGVTAGEVRKVLGKAGDSFVFIDGEGDGHTSARRGDQPLQVINARLKEPWTALSKSFKGWPDFVLPPKEIAPAVSF